MGMEVHVHPGIRSFIDYSNHERYCESLNNLTPADVFYGRGRSILKRPGKINQNPFAMRRQMHYDNRATNLNLMS